MSLLDDYRAPCRKLIKETTEDGEGGFFTTWRDGLSFDAVICLDSSGEAIKAENKGESNVYTVIVPKESALNYNEVFVRVSDGKTFKVVSNGNESETPKSASINMRKVTAEECMLT